MPAGIDPEGESAELHQWLCLCRQLMQETPILGARDIAGGLAQVRSGWNKEIPNEDAAPWYVHYDFSGGHAHRMRALPSDVDEASVNVYRIELPDDARTTPLWARLDEFTAIVAARGAPDGLVVEEVARTLARYATLRRTRKSLGEASASLLLTVLQSEIGIDADTGTDPAMLVAQGFMRFAYPGGVTRHTLSLLYKRMYLALPDLLKQPMAAPKAMFIDQVQRLADATYDMTKLREGLNISGYFNATYVATFCAGAAIAMCSPITGVLDKLGLSLKERERLSRLGQNLDEHATHRLTPTFELPARLTAGQQLRFVRLNAAFQRKPVRLFAEEHAMHPALVALLDAKELDEMSDATVQARYAQTASERPGLSIDGALATTRDAIRLRITPHLL